MNTTYRVDFTYQQKKARNIEDINADNIAVIADIVANKKLNNKQKHTAIDAIMCGNDVSAEVRLAVADLCNAEIVFTEKLNYLSEC